MSRSRLIAPLAVLSLCAAAAGAPASASAAGGTPVGNYIGDAVHPNPSWSPDGDPFTSRLVMRISKHRGGLRLTGLVGTVRFFCADVRVKDVRIVKMDFTGPRVSSNGSFAYRTKAVTFEGQARGGRLTGVLYGGNQECGVNSVSFTLRRVAGSSGI
jgi:hypothetical protein